MTLTELPAGARAEVAAALTARGPDQALIVSRLVKRYGAEIAVDGISFSVERGEIFGLLGPNGAGKTTTIEIIEGLREPDGGEIEVLGRPRADHLRHGRSRVGIQLQGTALPRRLTVGETLDLFAAMYNAPNRSTELLAQFGLVDARRKLVYRLSGGQAQRLALALAFVKDPELLILDEPTVSLDPVGRRDLWDLVRARAEAGAAVLLATHDLHEAEQLCHRVAVIDHGRVIALGAPRALAREHFSETALRVALEAGDWPVPLDRLPAVTRIASLAGASNLAGAGVVARANPEWSANGATPRGPQVLYTTDPPRTLAALLALGSEHGLRFASIEVRAATLEDVFLKLTGRGFAP